MRIYSFPARYQRFLEQALERALREIALDEELRATDAKIAAALGTARVREPLIADEDIDPHAHGSASVLLVGSNGERPTWASTTVSVARGA